MPTALITGATQGLGRALATALADRGWNLVLTARSGDALDELVEGLRAAGGGSQLRGVAGDVASSAHRRAVEEVVEDLTGPAGLDLLVNNASTLGPTPLRDLREVTADDLSGVLAVNVVAPHDLARSLLPALETARGIVVGVSSDAAVGHYETWGAYGASKAALDHLTLTLGAENPVIRAYAVDPGDMRTAMHQAAFPGEDIGDRPLPTEVAVPGILSLLLTRPPSGRYRAADLAGAPAQGVAS
ncbi:short-chain dehydrogenase [Intrasporangium oryzae NRRL B-24470]|uniref:Short-chain dehydrogenase n=1 Tax=Intrasporangium oryzae NRRL B-24470 TaxID=1386089 RepID=W9G9P9_9MICO|nr:SDR family oxidoreductase [Intrasporangium oryzae]EWT00574.1 short-chain dehydrogenase [Intrasporangium oryzae NRRL B-24470]